MAAVLVTVDTLQRNLIHNYINTCGRVFFIAFYYAQILISLIITCSSGQIYMLEIITFTFCKPHSLKKNMLLGKNLLVSAVVKFKLFRLIKSIKPYKLKIFFKWIKFICYKRSDDFKDLWHNSLSSVYWSCFRACKNMLWLWCFSKSIYFLVEKKNYLKLTTFLFLY